VDNDLVFATRYGTELDAANVRRAFQVLDALSRLVDGRWRLPLFCRLWRGHGLRQSFVSLPSSSGVAIEDIAHLAGQASTNVTDKVYCKEIRPVLTRAATAMDALFGGRRAGRSD
jgi:hypothetical protein